jgi:hypothetical protein
MSPPEQSALKGLSITVALGYGPMWYERDWWSQSSHSYDYLGHESHPYSELPKTTLTATPDETLASIYDRAGEVLGIGPGSHAIQVFSKEGNPAALSLLIFHVGFYRPSDDESFDIEHSYNWTTRLPVADMDGSVRLVSFREVTYRQLLASQRLRLIVGDVTRPYICPSMRQGNLPAVAQATHVAVEAVRAAYAGLDVAVRDAGSAERAAREHIDDAQRAAFLWMLWQSVKKRFRKGRKSRKDSGDGDEGSAR